MPSIEPQEIPTCETCGWSREFCTCPDDREYEEEEEF
jgi:hypothetical protein